MKIVFKMTKLSSKNAKTQASLKRALPLTVAVSLFAFVPLSAIAQGGAVPGDRPPAAAGPESAARNLVHVLDYLARDYGAAVQNGQVANEFEYAEQKEFAAEAIRLVGEIPALSEEAELKEKTTRLAALVEAKASGDEVSSLARDIASGVLARSGLATYPLRWPSLSRGWELYEARCVSCHGAAGKGNGPSAAGLDPPPADLTDPGRVLPLSPFSVFNTIRLGVAGTAMADHGDLPDEETWDLAFYTLSIRHGGPPSGSPDSSGEFGKKIPSDLFALQARASLSGEAVLSKAGEAGLPPEETLSYLRTQLSPESDAGFRIAFERLSETRSLVASGDYEAAAGAALSAYLDGIEPFEANLVARDADLVLKIEQAMTELRTSIRNHGSAAEVNKTIARIETLFARGQSELEGEDLSPSLAATSAAAVLLREGLEAILVLAALLAAARASGAPRLARQIHLGWIVALLGGVLTWMLSGSVIELSGAVREELEGITGALAVFVLLYVGFWLHRQARAEETQRLVDQAAQAAGRKGWGLFALSFLAVYREAFETVLFLRSLWLESGDGAAWAVPAGAAAGFVLMLVLGVALFRFEVRLPVKQVFLLSAWLLGLLTFVLAGKAAHAFQESGRLPVHFLSWAPRIDLLGLYPFLETLLTQAAVLFAILTLWWAGSRMAPKDESGPVSEPVGAGR
ncbi:MAG: FTR1 family protein [Bdellovibrionota bacterium]